MIGTLKLLISFTEIIARPQIYFKCVVFQIIPDCFQSLSNHPVCQIKFNLGFWHLKTTCSVVSQGSVEFLRPCSHSQDFCGCFPNFYQTNNNYFTFSFVLTQISKASQSGSLFPSLFHSIFFLLLLHVCSLLFSKFHCFSTKIVKHHSPFQSHQSSGDRL